MYESTWTDLDTDSDELLEYEGRKLASTWSISLQQVAQQEPDAVALFKFLAYLSNEDIWYELIQAGAPEGPPWMKRVTATKLRFNNAMTKLASYSLVEVVATSYRLHSCVHDWSLEYLNSTLCKTLFTAAVCCVVCSLSIITSSKQSASDRRLLKHLKRFEHTRFRSLDEILGKVGTSLGNLYRYHFRPHEAEMMYSRVIGLGKGRINLNARAKLDVACEFMYLFRRQDRLEQAEALFEWAICGDEEMQDHKAINGLMGCATFVFACMYMHRDGEAEAERIWNLEVSASRTKPTRVSYCLVETVLALSDPYCTQEKFTEAEILVSETLEKLRNTPDMGQSDHLRLLSMLGRICLHSNRSAEAEEWFAMLRAGATNSLNGSTQYRYDCFRELAVLARKAGGRGPEYVDRLFDMISLEEELDPVFFLVHTRCLEDLMSHYEEDGKEEDAEGIRQMLEERKSRMLALQSK